MCDLGLVYVRGSISMGTSYVSISVDFSSIGPYCVAWYICPSVPFAFGSSPSGSCSTYVYEQRVWRGCLILK